jgi:hypothetical protein
MNRFADYFRKYKLRAEFETCSAFAQALAQKGYFYEESIFSHWQKGKRIPTNRQLILTIIAIFIEKNSINNLEEANNFLATTGLGYLTKQEAQNLFSTTKHIDLTIQST